MTVPPPAEATAILLFLIMLILLAIAIRVWRKPEPIPENIDHASRDVDRITLATEGIRRVLIDVPFGAIREAVEQQRLTNDLLLDIAEYVERIPAPQPATTNVSRETPDVDALAEKTERMSLAIAALIMGEHPAPQDLTAEQAAVFARGVRYSANLVKTAMTNPPT